MPATGPLAARRPALPRRRTALGVAAAALSTGGLAVLAAGGAAQATAAQAAPRAAAACSTPAPKAAGAGSAAATVRRIALRAGTTTTEAPKITSPRSAPPKRLVKTDLVRCSGARASTGDAVELRYSLVVWGGRKKVVDTTWGTTAGSASFQLERTQLIKGFVNGIRGMRDGGRRVIVVPPSQGYGKEPMDGIPANSTLIFVVDLVKVG